MNTASAIPRGRNGTRIRLFLALSRTPHLVIDLAAPSLAALLSLGAFPSFGVTLLGLFTAFAGYTAVYALNDLVDLRSDREKMASRNIVAETRDLDALLVRHPLAQGLLSFKEAFLWTFGWGAAALLGAWILNPICLLIFFAACLLEVLYCLLLRVTPFRAILNGWVKSAGPLAAVFAVNPAPSLLFLALVFFYIFCWEIGGQNIPNDWTDMAQDRSFRAQTIPIRFGPDRSARLILISLGAALLFSLLLFAVSPAEFVFPFYLIIALAGGTLLLWPAFRLQKSGRDLDAMRLFNWASYYPLMLLGIATVNLIV